MMKNIALLQVPNKIIQVTKHKSDFLLGSHLVNATEPLNFLEKNYANDLPF